MHPLAEQLNLPQLFRLEPKVVSQDPKSDLTGVLGPRLHKAMSTAIHSSRRLNCMAFLEFLLQTHVDLYPFFFVRSYFYILIYILCFSLFVSLLILIFVYVFFLCLFLYLSLSLSLALSLSLSLSLCLLGWLDIRDLEAKVPVACVNSLTNSLLVWVWLRLTCLWCLANSKRHKQAQEAQFTTNIKNTKMIRLARVANKQHTHRGLKFKSGKWEQL